MLERRKLRILCTAAFMITRIAVTASGAPASVQAVLGRESVDASARMIVVTSAADSGVGTLRQALLDAQGGDTITFDPAIFPPSAPVTISVTSELPHIRQGNLTIDGSDSWVILDGSDVPGGWVTGLQIVESDRNAIRGLQVSNFSGVGIAISDGAYNVIGGDRSIGAGPIGQGNLTSHNDAGIGLWGGSPSGASFNTIMGNLIGSDGAGVADLGNYGHGIMIMEGSSDNIIGPDNVVAHNDGRGVSVADPDSLRNTITQNSIHDNDGNGIGLSDGGNTELTAPIIFEFDLQAGTVTGGTCSNCTVEVFSDSSDEGGIYEGRTTADDIGVFALNKGAAFIGPHLTATTTDVDGNTSRFSWPTSGPARSLILQRGNDLPKTRLVPKHSRELLDNRIGAYFHGFATPEFFDLGISRVGFKRARAAINGLDADLVDWSRPEFSIHPSHDDVFTRMADNDIAITYVLSFWDKATYPGGEGAPCPRFKTEGEIRRYLDYVRFIVRHFKDRVDYYEIWNEPDVRACPQWIEAADYINLVKRTVPVIREEYPEAKIQVGGTASMNLRSTGAYDYLFEILESDIMPLVDVVSWHPMYGTSPACDVYREYYYQYPSLAQEIKDVASAHGFAGEYEADELSWRTTENPAPDQPCAYSWTVAAKYSGRAILLHLGMDIGVSLGGGSGPINNLYTIMAGAEPVNLPLQIQSTVTNTVSTTFSLPHDNHLVALWTDGVAVDDDPGIEATLILPGFSDHKVMGIDVLHRFEQQVTTSEEDGNLVIRGLLVKDYPIILRVSPIRYVFLPVVLRSPSGQNQVDADCPGPCAVSRMWPVVSNATMPLLR